MRDDFLRKYRKHKAVRLLGGLFPLLLLCLMPGCSLNSGSMGTAALLKPPMSDKQHEDIKKALEEYADGEISPVYPKSGENTAAYLTADLDGDGSDEAVVFYRKSFEDRPLHMNILDDTGEGFKSVYDSETEYCELDRLEIQTLGDSKKARIIAGHETADDEKKKAFTVYEYGDGKVTVPLDNEIYSFFKVLDLNGDGKNELLTISGQSNLKNAEASVYRTDNKDTLQNVTEKLSDMYTGYKNVTFSEGHGGKYIFLDAEVSAGSIMTEILSYDKGGNLSKIFTPDSESSETLRQSAYITKDANGDGVPEIPIPHLCPGYDQSGSSQVYFTSWYNGISGKLQHCFESIASPDDSFIFILPESWEGMVTAGKNTSKGTVTLISGNEPDVNKEIFSALMVTDKKTADKLTEKGYQTAFEKSGSRCMVSLKTGNTGEISCSFDEIKNNFKQITNREI